MSVFLSKVCNVVSSSEEEVDSAEEQRASNKMNAATGCSLDKDESN